jgi:hypothetical protein
MPCSYVSKLSGEVTDIDIDDEVFLSCYESQEHTNKNMGVQSIGSMVGLERLDEERHVVRVANIRQ